MVHNCLEPKICFNWNCTSKVLTLLVHSWCNIWRIINDSFSCSFDIEFVLDTSKANSQSATSHSNCKNLESQTNNPTVSLHYIKCDTKIIDIYICTFFFPLLGPWSQYSCHTIDILSHFSFYLRSISRIWARYCRSSVHTSFLIL